MENGRVDIFKWWKWFYIFLIVKTVKKEIEFDMTFVPVITYFPLDRLSRNCQIYIFKTKPELPLLFKGFINMKKQLNFFSAYRISLPGWLILHVNLVTGTYVWRKKHWALFSGCHYLILTSPAMSASSPLKTHQKAK